MENSFFEYQSSVEVLRGLLKSPRGRPVSIRKLSKDLGYASDRTLGMVLKGQRFMTDEMAAKISRKLELTSREKHYLSLLLRKDRAASHNKDTKEILTELNAFKAKHFKEIRVTDESFAALTDWYSFAVLRILASSKEPMKVSMVTARLRGGVTNQQVERILLSLTQLGFVTKSMRGFAKREGFDFVRTMSDVPSGVIRKYHRNQLSRAADTLDEQSVLDRLFVAKTFTMSPVRIKEAKKRLSEFLESFSSEFTDSTPTPSDEVFQLNLQFYLQTK